MDRGKFISLDGLRGVAALVVFHIHVANLMGWGRAASGYLAVDAFFMMSGFVVPFAYEAKLKAGLGVARFFEIRAIRLYPLYILGVAIGFAPYLLIALGTHQLWLLHAPLRWLPWAVLMVPRPTSDIFGAYLLNPPAWSLFLEIVINIAYALALPRLSNRVLVAIIAVSGVLLGFAVAAFGTDHLGIGGMLIPLGLPRIVCPFTIGVLFFRLWRDGRLPAPRVPAWLPALLFLAVALMPDIGWALPLLQELVALPLIVLLALASRPSGATATVFAAIGALSYPLYALHMPILIAARQLLPLAGIGERAATMIAAPAAVLIAALAIRWYDAPVRRWLSHQMALRRRTVEDAPAL